MNLSFACNMMTQTSSLFFARYYYYGSRTPVAVGGD